MITEPKVPAVTGDLGSDREASGVEGNMEGTRLCILSCTEEKADERPGSHVPAWLLPPPWVCISSLHVRERRSCVHLHVWLKRLFGRAQAHHWFCHPVVLSSRVPHTSHRCLHPYRGPFSGLLSWAGEGGQGQGRVWQGYFLSPCILCPIWTNICVAPVLPINTGRK